MSKAMDFLPVTKCFHITTGKLNSNAAVENGQFPFFTCAKEQASIDSFAFDQEALLLAGNNAQGQYDVKHYSGKFNAYQRTYVLTLANKSHSYNFYKYALQAQLELLKSSSKGTNTKYITMEILDRTLLPVPEPAEQKRIAAILDKADAIRRKRQQAIQLADDFLRAVFLEMFGDPVTNPKGWEVKPLKDLAHKIGSGSTPRGGSESYQTDGISLIRSLNIHDNEFKFKDLAFIDDEQAERLSNVVVEENDVLLNITGASVCRCAIVPSEVLPARVNQHVCIIRPKANLYPSYLLHLLISHPYKQMLLQMSGAGATREALTKQQIENLQITIPPESEQEKFEKVRVSVNSLIKNAHSFSSQELFESLSQKAFSGQL
ncbi:restriction endonuclease subunit S [Vibrio cholerae]